MPDDALRARTHGHGTEPGWPTATDGPDAEAVRDPAKAEGPERAGTPFGHPDMPTDGGRGDSLGLVVGEPDDPYGQAVLRLWQDGALVGRGRRRQGSKAFSARLKPDEADRILRALARTSPPSGTRHVPVPDEPLYRLAVRGKMETPPWRVWRGELERDLVAAEALRTLARAVADASAGEVLL